MRTSDQYFTNLCTLGLHLVITTLHIALLLLASLKFIVPIFHTHYLPVFYKMLSATQRPYAHGCLNRLKNSKSTVRDFHVKVLYRCFWQTWRWKRFVNFQRHSQWSIAKILIIWQGHEVLSKLYLELVHRNILSVPNSGVMTIGTETHLPMYKTGRSLLNLMPFNINDWERDPDRIP